MNKNKLIAKALEKLTTTQRSLFCLLTKENIEAVDVKNFLKNYDIENESAVTSFFINDLLDKFDLAPKEFCAIPRIRGLKDYFRFHNAADVMKTAPGELTVKPDLFLKIRYPEEIRPFVSFEEQVSINRLKKLAGKKYCLELINSANRIRGYCIPNDSHIVDLLYLNLRTALNYPKDEGRIFCDLYDIYRYCTNQKCSRPIRCAMTYSVIRKTIRKMLI